MVSGAFTRAGNRLLPLRFKLSFSGTSIGREDPDMNMGLSAEKER
jgi:hypothetical protein